MESVHKTMIFLCRTLSLHIPEQNVKNKGGSWRRTLLWTVNPPKKRSKATAVFKKVWHKTRNGQNSMSDIRWLILARKKALWRNGPKTKSIYIDIVDWRLQSSKGQRRWHNSCLDSKPTTRIFKSTFHINYPHSRRHLAFLGPNQPAHQVKWFISFPLVVLGEHF